MIEKPFTGSEDVAFFNENEADAGIYVLYFISDSSVILESD